MFPTVEVRHLHAVIVLAEELNFTRASHRLNITQSTLSKQISELEERHRFQLFTRDNRRVVRVELTDAGRVFVEEARSLLLHIERAFHLARVAHDGGDNVLAIGHSPYADQAWVSAILAIRLPLYPKLRVRLMSQFSIESVRSVMAGELNLALVTVLAHRSQPNKDRNWGPFFTTQCCVARLQAHKPSETHLESITEKGGRSTNVKPYP